MKTHLSRILLHLRVWRRRPGHWRYALRGIAREFYFSHG